MQPRHLLTVLVAALCLLPRPYALAQEFTQSDYEFLEEPVSGEVDVRAELRIGNTWPDAAVARIVFCYEDDDNFLYLQMAASGAMLAEVRDGEESVLATAATWPEPTKPGVHTLTIKRRAWSIRVLCDRRTILTAYDQFSPGEKIGAAAREVKVHDLHVQPIGEMMFNDDFARPPGEPNPWHTVSGYWQIRLPEARNNASEAAKTANPFSYVATGSEALTVAGSSFWDGYELRAAVKPVGEGAVGLAFYAQDPTNYLLFRVGVVNGEEGSGQGRAEMLRVVDGAETVLAEHAAAIETKKWCELSVRAHDGRLEGLLDGEVVCEARDDTFGEGKIGLFMQDCSKAHFDDVALEPYRFFEDAYSAQGAMPVEQLCGTWTIHQERLCGRPDPATSMAIGLTGCPQWRDYTFDADILPWSATGAGLYFGCTGPQDYYLFRWGPDRTGAQQDVQELWQVTGGQGSLLASRPAYLNRTALSHVTVTADASYLRVAVDGKPALEAVDLQRPSAGRVGYYVEGTQQAVAAFDNMRVSFCEPPAEPVSITEQFAREDTMADWARPLASWKALGSRLYAYDLPVWGDFDLRIRLRHLVGRSGSIGLRLAGDNDALNEAQNTIQIVSEKDNPELKCIVPGGEGQGVSGATRSEEEEPLLELQRRGSRLLVSLDGKAFAWARGPDGSQAPSVGIKLDGLGINLNNATLTSPNIIDAAFSGAPTEWRPQSGVWEISDRWNCQPQWGWFCGREAAVPLIWSKRTFTGDMVFEFWAGVMMDLRTGPGYSHPSDLNGIICGDGENLCSGYAFVYAGDNNTRTKIIRRGETVAQTSSFRFSNPTSGNANFHRHWFHCRAERTGSHLTFLIDGRKALEYDDPSPLSGGHVGFWTHQHNGILIARTRIAHRE